MASTLTKSERALRAARQTLETLEAAGHAARLAGGSVRDRLLGLEPVDYDVATTARPEAVCSIFEQKGQRVVPTGVSHGTVTLVGPVGPIEITTLREDVATDGRRATVIFGTSFEADAARRDFTINAMFEDRAGAVFDFFDGQVDLQARRLRFVGEPERRIREDYLRILRFFRFWARFTLSPDEGALDSIERLVEGLSRVSQERITQELIGLLGAVAPASALAGMQATGVLATILPEASPAPVAARVVEGLADLPREARALARLAALLPRDAGRATAESLGPRLRLSREATAQLAALLAGGELPANVSSHMLAALELIDRLDQGAGEGFGVSVALPTWSLLWPERAAEFAAIARAEAEWGHRRRAPLPISGRELMAEFGLAPGEDLGRLLAELKAAFRRGEFASHDEALAWAKARLAHRT